MDPVMAALAAAGFIKSLSDKADAKKSARENIALQQNMLNDAMMTARMNSLDRMKTAGAPKTDQFGNVAYYDPTTGAWNQRFTEQQQRLIDQGQQRQERTNVRGAQASEDYNKERTGYLYDQPQTEAESRAEIMRLIQQSRGEGDRALATLVNRDELRQKGNLPVINTGPLAGSDAGKRLAETMLQARSQALNERAQRVKTHNEQYLPGMKQFETTANTVAPIDPTGQQIVGMAQQGTQDVLGAQKDLGAALMQAYGVGSGATNAASAALVKASEPEKLGQYAALIRSLQTPKGAAPKGTVGNTTGARYTAGGDEIASDDIGTHDQRFNFGPTTKGAGGEAARLGSIWPPEADPYAEPTIASDGSFNSRWFF